MRAEAPDRTRTAAVRQRLEDALGAHGEVEVALFVFALADDGRREVELDPHRPEDGYLETQPQARRDAQVIPARQDVLGVLGHVARVHERHQPDLFVFHQRHAVLHRADQHALAADLLPGDGVDGRYALVLEPAQRAEAAGVVALEDGHAVAVGGNDACQAAHAEHVAAAATLVLTHRPVAFALELQPRGLHVGRSQLGLGAEHVARGRHEAAVPVVRGSAEAHEGLGVGAFVPEQFGEFAEAFTLRSDGEVKSASFEDDKPQVPALVSATGAYDPTAVDGNSALFTDAILRGDGLSLTNTRATLYSPIVATRIGMRVERISFPFVTDVCRLRQFATLFFQRKLAEANTLSASFVFRPLITPNRPIHYVARERMAWCQSVDMSLSKQVAHGIPTTSASFRYVRRRDSVTGEYRLITGSSNMPLSFNGSGPGINPQRGILINESYAPGGEIPDPSVNTLCPGDAIIGRPPVTTLLQLQTGSGGLGTVFDPDQEAALGECSTNEEDLTVTAQSLWRELQSYAFSEYALALELICTHNPGSAHESIEPYGHNNSPSPAFDIKITREDGSPGGIDDYVAVGMLGESLGLVWGGALGAGDDTVTRVQSRILERAQWHYNNETPYIWKGNGPPEDVGVDCSGLVVNCYRYAGIFSRTADYSAGTLSSMFPAPVGRDPLPGELVFYLSENGAADGKLASHVTIIAEDGQSVYSARGNQSCTTLDRAAERNAKVVKRDLATYRRSEFTHYGAVFELVAYSSSNLNHFSTESAGPSSGSN